MYKVKHKKVDQHGNNLEVEVGPFTSRRTAENVVMGLAGRHETRGAEIVSSNSKSLKPRAKKAEAK